MKKIVYLALFLLFLLNLTSCKIAKNNNETNYLETSETITVSSNDYYYTFKPKSYSKGIIIFPKDEVDAKEYAKLMHLLAEKGYITFIVKDWQINDVIPADVIFTLYSDVTNWYIGGHSNGGTYASNYVTKHSEKVDGLFLLASYSNDDLNEAFVNVLSIYGSKDNTLDKNSYNTNYNLLGSNVVEYIIEGGNHTDFYTNQDSSSTIDKTITQIIKLTNKEKPTKPQPTYYVSYITNGHGNQPTNLSQVTALPNELPTLSEDGWIFEGWYYDQEFNKPAFTEDIIIENINLYAKWRQKVYSITYVNNGHGTTLNKDSGSKIPPILPQLSDDDYEFVGWYYDQELTKQVNPNDPLTDNVILYAKWEQIIINQTYSIAYNNNGHGIKPNDVDNTTTLPNELPQLIDDRWKFIGWYYDEEFTILAKQNDILTSDVTLHAKWEQITYTISYIINGHGIQPTNISEATNLPDTLPQLIDDGWEFIGWYYDEEFTILANSNDTLTKNTILFAKWEFKKYEEPTDCFMYSSNSSLVSVDGNVITLLSKQTSDYTSVDTGTYVTIPVYDVDMSKVYISIKYKATNITAFGLHMKARTTSNLQETGYIASIISKGWNVSNEDCGNSTYISTANVTSYLKGYEKLDAVMIKLTGNENATLEILDFIITTDGKHGFSVTDSNQLTYTQFNTSSNSPLSISTNQKGEQIFTYSSSPGWHEIESNVYNYTTDYSMLEFKFSSTHETVICFAIQVDGVSEENLGHITYKAGKNQTILLNITTLTTSTNFKLRIYIDAKVSVTTTKTITVHSYKIIKPEDVEPTPEPEKYQDTITYTESIETFTNPDQGFYTPLSLVASTTGVKASISDSKLYNNALLHLRINIGAFSSKINGSKDLELTLEMLNELDQIFTKINNSGSCVIVRFAYTYEDIANIEPEISMIIRHIEQFSPLINKHKNMVTAVECGLVGPWGEMHSSDIANQTTYNKLLDKYISCLESDINLLVRRPKFIYEYYGLSVKTLDQFDYANNRLGCYNDGYLGSKSDLGTYVDRTKEVEFLSKINQTNPYGGEVVNPASDNTWNHLENACEEMFKTNLSYLNKEWNGEVIERWKNTTYSLSDPLYKGQSEFTYIANHMGYRFVCEQFSYLIEDTLKINLEFKNVGFGELYKTKKVFVILKNSKNQYVFEYDYYNELEITENIDISNVSPGTYQLYIVLADEFTNKAIRGIRFANENMYDENLQANLLANIKINN